MSRNSTTKDERFLLAICQAANKDENTILSIQEMAQMQKLSESTAQNIVNILAQTGFIQCSKREGILHITQRGIVFCEELEKQFL